MLQQLSLLSVEAASPIFPLINLSRTVLLSALVDHHSLAFPSSPSSSSSSFRSVGLSIEKAQEKEELVAECAVCAPTEKKDEMASPRPRAASAGLLHGDAAEGAVSALGRSVETDAGEGLVVVKRIDFSPICAHTKDFGDNSDDGSDNVASAGDAVDAAPLFYDPDLKIDVAGSLQVIVGFQQALFTTPGDEVLANISRRLSITGDTKGRGSDALLPGAVSASSSVTVVLQALQLLDDGSSLDLDDDERITDVKWIGNEYFCASYTSGVIRIFNHAGKLVFEQVHKQFAGAFHVDTKFHTVAITKLDVSRNPATAVGSRRMDAAVQNRSRDEDGELWILYEDATVAIIQLSELFAKITSVVFAQASKFRKYHLRDQSDIVSAVPCGSVRPTIFQSHPRIGVCTIISAGSSPFLSFYHAGNDQNSIIHLAHIASAMASRAAGAVWSFAKSWGWSSASEEQPPVDSGAVDDAAEHVAAPLGSIRSIAEDQRRRSRCLALSPTGRLAAVTDTLGRVLLIDTLRMIVIRMWKGYRNAQCGWMQGNEGSDRPQGLYLVIYSAQRGIVEVWRARYGPHASGKTARCIVLATSANGTSELIELKPSIPNLSILMKYFTQNKLQEENFLLHQIIAGLHAFVKKKKTDKHHVLEQDLIVPLLDDIASLSSTTTIEALLDVLISIEMICLSPTHLLKALDKIQTALKRGMSSHIPTGPELSLLWKVLWQHRIISAFIGLHGEFERSKRIALSNVEVSKALLNKHEAKAVKESDSALERVYPWLELFRRGGVALDDEACINTRKAFESVGKLNAWEFLELFSMPFSDPELPRRRDILALFKQNEKSEDFIRETLQTLRVPVFRKITNKFQRDTLLALAFTPILSSVFAVQTHTDMFLEWFFSLPLGTVLTIPPPNLSSSLQRWLGPYFTSPDTSDDLESEAPDSSKSEFAPMGASLRKLFPCSVPLKKIFSACWKTNKLFHAFVLSVHCGWGERQQATRLEDNTLGKYSSAGGGVRWSILQDSIAHAVHLSLRLGRMGRLSVEAVENVDEIMRTLALMQLNDGIESEDAASIKSGASSGNLTANADLDHWVAELEHCRNAAQMKDWQSVLSEFPQFASKDSLCCFRAVLLCTAWNAERSDMHQLDDALAEVDSLSPVKLKAAMATHIWEKYIRVHVVTLISFWEESAAGRKPQRGLQPQIARRFFGIIKNLLIILVTAINVHRSEAAALAGENDVYESDASDDEDGELPPIEDVEGEEKIRTPEYRMEFLTQSLSWLCLAKDLQGAFKRRWPPAHDSSSLIQGLAKFDVQHISLSQITDHLSLILLLDSFAATTVTPVSIVKLYANHGRHLCRPDSFLAAPGLLPVTQKEHAGIKQERTQFLKQLLRHDENLGIALAEAFGLSVDMIREEHILFLYQSGRDEHADLSVENMKSPERLALRLGSIARARLSLILQRMKAEPDFAMLMSILPADVFMWVVNEAQPPLVADPQVQKLDCAPSLTGTHYLLLKCLALIPPHCEEFTKVTEMSVLVKDIISQVKQHPSLTK
ncbi:Ras-related protein rab1bv, partial [Globisporangium splendens]